MQKSEVNGIKNVRGGVVNWDCSLPMEAYFGYYQTRTLSPKRYRSFTPYYADIINENKIGYHKRTKEEFDRELGYAIQAEIDYFAYVFYPELGSREHISLSYSDCSHRVFELNYARRMHEASALRDKIGIAAIVAAHPFKDEDISELVELLKAPYYEKVDGKPLVYIFRGTRVDVIERIRRACASEGVTAPFFVAMMGEEPIKDSDRFECVDALSAYACLKTGITEYSELCDEMLRKNRERLNKCRYIIPHYTVGWDPSPRIDIPSPWVEYEDAEYAKIASKEELLQGAERLAAWIKSEAYDSFIGHIMTFAWNEFEEGAWLCPTYNADLTVNEERISTFATISRYWKEFLK